MATPQSKASRESSAHTAASGYDDKVFKLQQRRAREDDSRCDDTSKPLQNNMSAGTDTNIVTEASEPQPPHSQAANYRTSRGRFRCAYILQHSQVTLSTTTDDVNAAKFTRTHTSKGGERPKVTPTKKTLPRRCPLHTEFADGYCSVHKCAAGGCVRQRAPTDVYCQAHIRVRRPLLVACEETQTAQGMVAVDGSPNAYKFQQQRQEEGDFGTTRAEAEAAAAAVSEWSEIDSTLGRAEEPQLADIGAAHMDGSPAAAAYSRHHETRRHDRHRNSQVGLKHKNRHRHHRRRQQEEEQQQGEQQQQEQRNWRQGHGLTPAVSTAESVASTSSSSPRRNHNPNSQTTAVFALTGELRRVEEEHQKGDAFVWRATSLMCTSLLGFCVTLLLLALTFGYGVIQIVFGAIYLYDCPWQPLVPIYLVVAGVFFCLAVLLNEGRRTWDRRHPPPEGEPRRFGTSNVPLLVTELLVVVFLTAWWIAGAVWVWGDCTPECKDPRFCSTTLYWAAYWILLAPILFIAFIFLIALL